MQKQSPRGVLWEQGVLRMLGIFGAVILIKLQSGFFGIALLHYCSPVGLLHVCGASFLENTSGGLLLNEDNFIHSF